jgi:excinuclease ABC subunit A
MSVFAIIFSYLRLKTTNFTIGGIIGGLLFLNLSMDKISILGAKTHNLKNISIDIPRDKLVIITGLSGSGKSSLAFDTIYAEGQRRYVESLSAYARQFLSVMEKPEVESINGLSPAISIEQKATSHNPRSTVGTITEIYDYLRLLFARVGEARCPEHQIPLAAQTISQITDSILALPENSKIMLLAPIVVNRKGAHTKLLVELSSQGFLRARIDGDIVYLDEAGELNKKQNHTIEIVVDRLKVRSDIKLRLSESLEQAANLSGGNIICAAFDDEFSEMVFSTKFACPKCDYSLTELEPRLFSFNNPVGACPECDGLGVKDVFAREKVVAHPHLSISEGAIVGWGKANGYFYKVLFNVAKHFGFSLDTPFLELDIKHQDIILYGSGSERIKSPTGKVKKFIGVIPTLEKRYVESETPTTIKNLSNYIVSQTCKSCGGDRLNKAAVNVFIGDKNLPELTTMSIAHLYDFFANLTITGAKGEIFASINKEITSRLKFLINVGLDYLSLARTANTLSGGEAQRIRLASQIGAGLMGVLYVLDEPSIGLHQRDNQKLINTLTYLRDLGNTVIVVEHDEEAIRSSDFIIDIGPGAGKHGGEIVASGNLSELLSHKDSLTADYLSGKKSIKIPKKRKQFNKKLELIGASGNNLKNIDLQIPIGVLTCITGVSGSGKSTLINRTLYPLLANNLNNATQNIAPFKQIKGLEHFDKIVNIDQSPIGRTPRSNPATYTGVFTLIRDLFAATEEARSRGYSAGRFSFNVKGGRCEACKGDGLIKVEMHFLPDAYVVCDVCEGKRYNRETLEITYKGKTISDVLDMTIEDSLEFFANMPKIKQKLQTLVDVGLSYLTLGQNAITLSGGEAQRVKLAKELAKIATGKTIYILDEPTTGLHFHDIKQLLEVIYRLREKDNTIVIIEHNLDVIKVADWIVDLGPEGGDGGGEIIATGTPEDVAKNKKSWTGKYLKEILK